jgi:hypothetical protein
MSVRKRTWNTARGELKEAWVITYTDRNGARCQETFNQKKLADARHAEIKVRLKAGSMLHRRKALPLRKLARVGLGLQSQADWRNQPSRATARN